MEEKKEESLEDQVQRLANYILNNCEGYPNANEGAIDCAIRILESLASPDTKRASAEEIKKRAKEYADKHFRSDVSEKNNWDCEITYADGFKDGLSTPTHVVSASPTNKESAETGKEITDYFNGFQAKLDLAFAVHGDGWFLDPIMKKMYNEILESYASSNKELQSNVPTKPHKCPVCGGKGKVNFRASFMSSTANITTCLSCNGEGIIWLLSRLSKETPRDREEVFYCSDSGNGAPVPCKKQCYDCKAFQAKGDYIAVKSQESEWISVEDKPIPQDVDVWTYQHETVYKATFPSVMGKHKMKFVTEHISHWMPYETPEPPDQKKNKG